MLLPLIYESILCSPMQPSLDLFAIAFVCFASPIPFSPLPPPLSPPKAQHKLSMHTWLDVADVIICWLSKAVVHACLPGNGRGSARSEHGDKGHPVLLGHAVLHLLHHI